MKFPSIRDVQTRLGGIHADLITASRSGDEMDDSIDIRLQVYPGGHFEIHAGDPSYDTDHRGFCGSTSMPWRERFSYREMARDLLSQCRDHHAQSYGAEVK